eukprot:6211183-Pleurochrysis_carterae.AAC.5
MGNHRALSKMRTAHQLSNAILNGTPSALAMKVQAAKDAKIEAENKAKQAAAEEKKKAAATRCPTSGERCAAFPLDLPPSNSMVIIDDATPTHTLDMSGKLEVMAQQEAEDAKLLEQLAQAEKAAIARQRVEDLERRIRSANQSSTTDHPSTPVEAPQIYLPGEPAVHPPPALAALQHAYYTTPYPQHLPACPPGVVGALGGVADQLTPFLP